MSEKNGTESARKETAFGKRMRNMGVLLAVNDGVLDSLSLHAPGGASPGVAMRQNEI